MEHYAKIKQNEVAVYSCGTDLQVKKKKSSWGGNENLFWQETEETASGYIFGWWGGNGEMRDERVLPDGKS